MAKDKENPEEVEEAPDRYEWWEDSRAVPMLRALADSLERAGPGARFCRHTKQSDDGKVSVFSVRDAAGETVGESFNDGWLCPPIC